MRRRVFIRTPGQVSLQGNANPNGADADVKATVRSIVYCRSRGGGDWFRGGKRSGVMRGRGRRSRLGVSRGWGRRSRLSVSRSRLSGRTRSRSGVNVMTLSRRGLMDCRGGLSGTAVVAMRTLRHCLVAKSADQANHNDCCEKLFHDVCLLYW